MSYEVKCKYCQRIVIRQQNVEEACCFSCKQLRQRETAKEYARKRKKHLDKLKRLNIK